MKFAYVKFYLYLCTENLYAFTTNSLTAMSRSPFLLIISLLFCTIVQAATYSGNCGKNGNNLTWSLDIDKNRLTISGSGAMADYTQESPSPWSAYQQNIIWVDIANTVTSLGHYAFSNCIMLYRITIPKAVTKLDQAFYNCENMEMLYLEWDTEATIPTWNDIVFGKKDSNLSLYIPCGTKDLYGAMDGWKNIYKNEIYVHGECGQGQGTILDWRIDCEGNLGIISSRGTVDGRLPDYTPGGAPWYPYRDLITSIGVSLFFDGAGKYAFYGCYNAKTASLNDYNASKGCIPESAFEGCTSLEKMVMYGRTGTVEKNAFRGCTSLRELYLTSVLTIQDSAFVGCTSLRALNAPFVQTIGNYAFGGCTGLRSVYFGSAGLTSIGAGAFKDCLALSDITVSWITGEIPTWPTQMTTASGITLHVPCGSTALYSAANGWKNYAIVENLMGFCSDTTEMRWMLDCDGNLSITGEGSMINYSSDAYLQPWYPKISSIKSVTIGEGITRISSRAFDELTQLKTVSIAESVREIGGFAFSNCSTLVSIELPRKMEEIGGSAFDNCIRLTRAVMPDSLGALGTNVFRYCNQLKSIRVPEGVTALRTGVFYNCTRLDTVLLPSTLERIYGAFRGCSSMKELTIPKSVNNMNSSDMFTGCKSLRDIYTQWTETVPQIRTDIYSGSGMTAANIKVHIPCGTKDLYSRNWTTKFTIDGGPYSGVCGTEGDSIAWLLDCDSVLTLTGYGAMIFDSLGIPWAEKSDLVRTIVLGDSLSLLADSAFAKCSNLMDIYASWEDSLPNWPKQMTAAEPQTDITLHVPCEALPVYRAAEGWKEYTIKGEGEYTVEFRAHKSEEVVSTQTVSCEEAATPPEAPEGLRWEWNSTDYESVTSDLIIYGRLVRETEGWQDIPAGEAAEKVLRDGQLLILRKGKTYTAQGVEIQ
jgi:hypothetical protein